MAKLRSLAMKIHVGNLSPKVTQEELNELFAKYGKVKSCELEWTRRAGRSGGKAILEMNLTEAMTAAKQLNGRPFRSRRLYITLMGDVATGRNFDVSAEAKSA